MGTDRAMWMARNLHRASRWLVFTTIVLTAVLLTAGTFTYHNWRRPMTLALGLPSLSMVSYDGIIPIKANISAAPYADFYFRISLFPNAFTWECPRCPAAVFKDDFVALAGTSVGPRWAFDALQLTRAVAVENEVSDTEWDCSPETRAVGQCTHPFFSAWGKHETFTLVPACLGFAAYILAITSAVATLVGEFLIAYQPHMMKCKCLVLGRWCPHPKGTFEEIEAVDEHFWDALRLWYFGATFVFIGLAALHDTVLSLFFARYLQFVEQFLEKRRTMNIQRGGPFLVLVWFTVGVAALALLLMRIRWSLTSKPASWMDEQGLDTFKDDASDDGREGLPGLADDYTEFQGALPSAYTDSGQLPASTEPNGRMTTDSTAIET